ncbi:PseG/SpsG family protein [Marinomonas sp. IMCC 4694]|uniref:PseG/SpsG family protein n=1 Tax=Marinomonas sp. IMCC 4694 TaxID=2605432 RepID=UPI0011E81CDC|nr:UDP-2,4-diacetamido-2,4,6-trideoxy-beta-L-altropyranose hydrolase [Marinomonas sp. IMCC 4694]TYL47154.1 UDP-2,4-diacetamido-2,4,6-trideoxy-beta-L-altropyranose hydrolase [Marinomonas sp. IMCC 4694]
MKALIRADASVELGMGHRVRCQALAHAFTQLGWHCHFVVDRRYEAFSASEDYLIDREEEGIALAKTADLMIVDHYGYSADAINALFEVQPALLVLDDMNDRGNFSAKWLLNPLNETYSTHVEHPLTGRQYALLRPEFLARSTQRQHCHASNQLLITLGGTDPLALTLPILQALKARGFPLNAIQVLLGAKANNAAAVKQFCDVNQIALEQGLSDVTPLMSRAKMAISAAGGTLFELAYFGVPTLFAQTADNQTRSLQQHVPLGWCDSVRFDSVGFDTVAPLEQAAQVACLVQRLEQKWHDKTWQQAARNIAQQCVDGRGAERVAKQVTHYFIHQQN